MSYLSTAYTDVMCEVLQPNNTNYNSFSQKNRQTFSTLKPASNDRWVVLQYYKNTPNETNIARHFFLISN